MRLAPLLLALVLPACSFHVAQLNPTPNVLLARSQQTLAFSVDGALPDTITSGIESPGIGSPGTTTVQEWHATLTNGFRNSIARFFAVPQGAPDLTLVMLNARPWLERVGDGVFRAHVRFQAKLVDKNNAIVKTWGDTTVSRDSASVFNADVLVRSALEAMYEEIANGMPVPPSPVVPPPTIP